MKPIQLHHAAIRVSDLDRSRAFYEKLIGLRPIERPVFGFPGTWYGLGAGQLHLIQRQPMSTAVDSSNPHFAIEVADLDEARRELAAAGTERRDLGGNQIWVLDPDGYTVEIRGTSDQPS